MDTRNAEQTLILTRRDVAALMSCADYLAAMEFAFLSLAEGRIEVPPPMHLHGDGGAFHVKGAACTTERPVVAVKLNGNFPGNRQNFGLPTIQGAILLSDARDGRLLAVMDSIEITLRRTAAASALAARHLARSDAAVIAICGCGEQGRAHLQAMRDVLPLAQVRAYDADPERAESFAAWASSEFGLTARACTDLSEATKDARVIVTCTTSRTAFLDVAHVAPGAFIAAVGADSPSKSEIAPALMEAAKIVTDLTDQCRAMGDLHHAPGSAVHAELGAIVAGKAAGRTDANEIVIFDSTGTAAQDVAAALRVHDRARGRSDLVRLDLGAG